MGSTWVLFLVTVLNAHQVFCQLLPPPATFFVEEAAMCNDEEGIENSIVSVAVLIEKHNRTTYTISGNLSALSDLPLTTQVLVKAYQRRGGAWVENPIVQIPKQLVCSLVQSDMIYWPNIVSNSDIPSTTCPFMKGDYKISNAILTFNNIPEFIEKGCWKGKVIFYNNEEKVGCVYVVGKILNELRNKPPMCSS